MTISMIMRMRSMSFRKMSSLAKSRMKAIKFRVIRNECREKLPLKDRCLGHNDCTDLAYELTQRTHTHTCSCYSFITQKLHDILFETNFESEFLMTKCVDWYSFYSETKNREKIAKIKILVF